MNLLRQDEEEPMKMNQHHSLEMDKDRRAPHHNSMKEDKPSWHLRDSEHRALAAALKSGKTEREVAAEFGVSQSTVHRARQMYLPKERRKRVKSGTKKSTKGADSATCSPLEVVAGGTPCDESPAGPRLAGEIKDWKKANQVKIAVEPGRVGGEVEA